MPKLTAGQRFRARIDAALVDGVSWDEREALILDLAMAQADEIERLEAVLEAQGPMVAGSMGQERLNPVFTEVRLARMAFSRLLQAVRLPDESGGAVKDVTKVRAAQKRWRDRESRKVL